jgi:Tol biopolymer transport system component
VSLRGETVMRPISFSATEGTNLSFDVSPDDRWIVLDLLGQLWRIPAAGGQASALTDAVADAAEDVDPIVSPDGAWIVFQGDRNDVEGLWLIPAEGGAPRLLPGTEASVRVRWKTYFRPAWSRDGRQIAFIRDGRVFLYQFDRDSTSALALQDPPPGILRHVDWLADDRMLVSVRVGRDSGVFWLVEPATGRGTQVPTDQLPDVISHAVSPDGGRIAYIVEDDELVAQLLVRPIQGGEPVRVTSQPDVLPSRVRWAAGGEELLYVAGGRLWRVALATGQSREIPFTADVAFQREEPALPPVRFPDAGTEHPARGHMGLALSPDGSRIALLALGRLWVWPPGAAPRAMTDVPITAAWPSWSPDGRGVAWSAGAPGAEDIYVTDLGTGRTRRVTSLGGTAARPSWSPDGRRIAFLYGPDPSAPPADRLPRFAIVPASAENVRDPAALTLLPNLRFTWLGPGLSQERANWSPTSDALLYYQPGCVRYSCIYGGGPATDDFRIVPLAGDPIALQPLTDAATFVHWAADSSLIYVHGSQLWRAAFGNRSFEEPVRLVEEPTLYPSVARDGSILYIAPDGYRIRRPDGRITPLGWPLSYTIPHAAPLLITGATVIDGTGAAPSGRSDMLVENGRIARIAPAGSIHPGPGVEVIAAEGRFLLPGLVDLHSHAGTNPIHYLAYLYHGVTMVRDMGSPLASTAAFAEAAAAGVFPGPRVVLGAVAIHQGAPYAFTGAAIQGTRDRMESERALRLAQGFGASFIKMQFPPRWAAGAELIRQAHSRGFRIGGHCAHPLPLIAAGIQQLEHLILCKGLNQAPPQQDLVQLYHDAGVTVTPTFSGRGAVSAGITIAAAAGGQLLVHIPPTAQDSRERVARRRRSTRHRNRCQRSSRCVPS